jgi:hypothetical protein
MSALLGPLVLIGLFALISAVTALRARRRRAAYAAGEDVTFRVLLGTDSPRRAGRFTPGRVQVAGGRAVWSPKPGRRAQPVDLTGAQPVRADVLLRTRSARPTDAGLLVVLPDGARVRLVAHHKDLPLLQEALERSDPGAPPRAPARAARGRGLVPWWAAVLLAVTSLWFAFWIWSWTAGTWVEVTLVGPRDDVGECLGRWTNPANGEGHAAAVKCAESWRPGDRVRALALPDPWDGEAGTYTDAVTIPAAIGGTVLAATAIAIAVRHWWPHRDSQEFDVLTTRPEVPELGEGELGYARIAEVLTARAAVEGWGPTPSTGVRVGAAGEQIPRRWWRVPRLRRFGCRLLGWALFPLLFVAAPALYGATYWWTTAVLATGDTAVTEAVVKEYLSEDRLPFMPSDATVTFTADGHPASATVATTRELREGEHVTVLYAADHPGAARLEGAGDGLTRIAAVTGAAAVLLCGFAAVRGRRVLRALAAVRRAREQPGRTWRYVRFLDPVGNPGLMIFSRWDDGPPEYLLPLHPFDPEDEEPGVVGTVDLHGEVGDGATLVPVIDGRTLWPAGVAEVVPPDIVRDLVNGSLPAARPSAPK